MWFDEKNQLPAVHESTSGALATFLVKAQHQSCEILLIKPDVIWQEIKPKHFYCLGFSARATQVEKYPNSGPLFHPCAAASLTKLVSHDDDAFRSWDLFAGYNAGGTTQVILSSLEID